MKGLISNIIKNKKEILRITLLDCERHHLVGIRVWTRDDPLKPTQKGLSKTHTLLRREDLFRG